MLVMITVLLLLILLSLWVVLYQVVKQQGRILLQLADLEKRHLHMQAAPIGTQFGEPFPPFEAPDMSGKVVASRDLRGKLLFLVHWSTQCSFCNQIASDLALLQPAFQDHGVNLVLISYGTAEANNNLVSEHHLSCPILLSNEGRTIEGFRGIGTPAAYVINGDGRVASQEAVGSEVDVHLIYSRGIDVSAIDAHAADSAAVGSPGVGSLQVEQMIQLDLQPSVTDAIV